jgi:hypothetical protein
MPAAVDHMTQLDDQHWSAVGNDDPSHWCLTDEGTACRAAVFINELMYDVDQPGNDAGDDGRTFIELKGPPGALIGGLVVRGLNSDGGVQTGSMRPLTLAPGLRVPMTGLWLLADEAGTTGATSVPGFSAELGQIVRDLDPQNGPDAIEIIDGTIRIDVVGYGTEVDNSAPPAAGTPTIDLNPDDIPCSLSRHPGAQHPSTNNAADFALDPTPTPGSDNDALAPAVLAISTTHSLVGRVRDIDITLIDVADAAGTGVEIGVTIAGQPVVPVSGDDDCSVVRLIDSGRGGAVIRCRAAAQTVPTRGDVRVRSASLFGFPEAVSADTYTVTGVHQATLGERCTLQTSVLPLTTSGTAVDVSVSLLWPGFTDAAANQGDPQTYAPGVTVEIGSGPMGVAPHQQNGFDYLPARTNPAANTDPATDAFMGTLTAPTTTMDTELRVVARVSRDGGLTHLYCDLDGVTGFEPQQMLPWRIRPQP